MDSNGMLISPNGSHFGQTNNNNNYTIPGILKYLQSEFARFELEKAQWKVANAEYLAQIAALKGKEKGQMNIRRDLIRRIKMLEFALKQERQKYYLEKTGIDLDLNSNGESDSEGATSSYESSDSDVEREKEKEKGKEDKQSTNDKQAESNSDNDDDEDNEFQPVVSKSDAKVKPPPADNKRHDNNKGARDQGSNNAADPPAARRRDDRNRPPRENRENNRDRRPRESREGGVPREGRGKREFDRRSGTGRRDGEKKDTNGPGNWGKSTDTQAPADGESPANDGEAAPAPVEEEDNTQTLEEYLAAKKAKENLPKLGKAREPNEGVNSKDLGKVVVFEKGDEEFYSGKGGKERKEKERKAAKQLVDINVKSYSDEARDSRRNRPSRGGPRGERQSRSAPPPEMNDSAFPSLGGK